MKKQFYNENELNKVFNWNKFNNLKETRLSKGESIYIDSAFFILKGEIDILFIDINGESFKLNTVTSKDVIVGLTNLFSKSSNPLHYTAKEETSIISLSSSDITDDQINCFNFLKFILKILGQHIENFTQIAILTNNYSNQTKLKFFLKQEMNLYNIVNLKKIGKFIEQHSFSRTTFYRELKKLENSGWLTKNKSIIKINEANSH